MKPGEIKTKNELHNFISNSLQGNVNEEIAIRSSDAPFYNKLNNISKSAFNKREEVLLVGLFGYSTIVTYCIAYNKLEFLEYILGNYEINNKKKYAKISIIYNSPESLNLFIKHGLDVTTEESVTPTLLFYLMKKYHLYDQDYKNKTILRHKRISEKMFPVKMTTDEGVIDQSGYRKMLNILLKSGVDVNALGYASIQFDPVANNNNLWKNERKGIYLYTVLDIACYAKDVYSIKKLIMYGAITTESECYNYKTKNPNKNNFINLNKVKLNMARTILEKEANILNTINSIPKEVINVYRQHKPLLNLNTSNNYKLLHN